MSNFINSAKECNIKTYMLAVLENKLDALIIDGNPDRELLIQAAANIQLEYMDLAGLTDTNESLLIKNINNLRLRIETIAFYLKIHRDCLTAVNEPFHPAINELKKFGHRLFWNKDNPDRKYFEDCLDKIELKEKRTKAELDNKIKEFTALKKKEGIQEINAKDGRIAFSKLLNNLGKFGYTIDKEKTTIEEMGLMVKEYVDAVNAQNTKGKN